MKKSLLIFLILTAGCIQQATIHETASEKKGAEINDDARLIGKANYKIFCVICHGAGGQADQIVTENFEVAPPSLVDDSVKRKSDQELFLTIRDGVNGTNMLSWGHMLNDEEIRDVVSYIRFLQEES
jgi:mono/diheme cytochrome c family protein